MLRGLGAAIALPWLDAMTPALVSRGAAARASAARPRRLVCIEIVHGAAGSSTFGLQKNLWAPSQTGRDFDLAGTSLQSLQPYRDRLTIVSNTDVAPANATEAREIGGDHFRSTAVFLTQAYPKRTEGPDVEVGTSLDQIYAQRFGQDSPIPSLQMCIEGIDPSGGCQYGYSCSYVDSLSWAASNKPLPMVRDPRAIFDALHSVSGSGGAGQSSSGRASDRSILDWMRQSAMRLKTSLGAVDRARLDDYLTNVREIERRIQIIETRNRSGEVREFPAAPPGIPDSFPEHVRLMFDLQVLAFRTDATRVITFKLSRDGSNRTYPESGFSGPFHNTSHHGNREERILELAKVNAYHVSQLPYLLEQLRATTDMGDGTLLDDTVVLYGSPMGDPNLHNHKRVPFIVIGRAGAALPGGVHVKAPNGTPLANAMLTILNALGLDDMTSFGDSEGILSLS